MARLTTEEQQKAGVGGKEYKKGTYDVGNWTFPADLHDPLGIYGDQWVMFNINVPNASSRAMSGVGIVDASQDSSMKGTRVAKEMQSGTRPSNTSDVAHAQSLVGGVMGVAAGLKTGSLVNAIADGITGALVGEYIAGLPYKAGGESLGRTKRIKEAIQLPMPAMVSANYSMEWGQNSTMMYDLAMRMGDAVIETVTKALSGNTPDWGAIKSVIKSEGTAAALGIGKIFGAEAVSAATGLAANTKREMIFQGVNFRTFQFDYLFFPRNQKESDIVKQIIKLFKFHMHPSFFGGNRSVFVYPSEFDIRFLLHEGFQNPYLNKIGTCCLKDMNVNYAPDGLWASHADGSPNAVRLQLTFQELGIVTQETVNAGY